MEGDLEIKRALISVYDKTGIVEFARKLTEHGITIISTGGTRIAIEKAGITVVPLETITHFPEMLDGRVKTLQPEVFGGILAIKGNAGHMRQIGEKGVLPIDMVVCNFYDFESVSLLRDSKVEELIEKIDIGGPSLIRAGAKNYESVCVVPAPSLYGEVSKELDKLGGKISKTTRENLALQAFRIVAVYDRTISDTLDAKLMSNKRQSLSGQAKVKA